MLSLLLFNVHALMRKPYAIFSLFLPKVKSEWFHRWLGYLIEEDGKNFKKTHFSSGTFKIDSDSHFYKLGLWQGGFKAECRNYKKIKAKYPLLAQCLPSIQLKRRFLFAYLKMEPYLCSYGITPAVSVLNILKEYGKKEIRPLSFFKNIHHGIYLSQFLYGKAFKKALLPQVVEILSLPWRLGPVHGDFHTANLLKGTRGPILIDFDSFSEREIQALDAFTFLIDFITKETRKTWQGVIDELTVSEKREEKYMPLYVFFDYDLKKIALLYALNRLGYENRTYFFLSRSVQKEYALLKGWVK